MMAKAEQTRCSTLKVILYSMVCPRKQNHNGNKESLKCLALRFSDEELLMLLKECGPFSTNLVTLHCDCNISCSIGSMEESGTWLIISCSVSFTTDAADTMLPTIWTDLSLADAQTPVATWDIHALLVARRRGHRLRRHNPFICASQDRQSR